MYKEYSNFHYIFKLMTIIGMLVSNPSLDMKYKNVYTKKYAEH